MAVIEQKMNADEVAKNLWVGGLPTDADAVDKNFDALVLASREFQDVFPAHKYPNTKLILAPMDDEPNSPKPPGPETKATALKAALEVHDLNKAGKKVLVTCAAGVNRSALIAAMAMVIGGFNSSHAINRIRKRRKPPSGLKPLFNQHFQKIIKDFDAELATSDSPTR